MVAPRLPNNKPRKCLKLRFWSFFVDFAVKPKRLQSSGRRKDAQQDCNSRASFCPRQGLFYLSVVPAEKSTLKPGKGPNRVSACFFRPLLFPLGGNPNKQIVFFFCWKNSGAKRFWDTLPGKSQRTGKTNHMHASFVKRHIYLRVAKTFKKLTSIFLL